MTATGPLWLFSELERHDWWQALTQLERADGSRATEAYARLFSALLQAGHDSPAEALAAALLDTTLPAGPARLRSGSPRRALELDLALFNRLAATDWLRHAGGDLPSLHGLNGQAEEDPVLGSLAAGLAAGTLGADDVLAAWAARGQGVFARGLAFRFADGKITRLSDIRRDSFSDLHGLERQTAELLDAVRPWLAGGPPVNVLLYGPRGSGKSSAARSLLGEGAAQGLRLVEVPPAGLMHLPLLLREAAGSPLSFVLFIDDLGFSAADAGWQDLKTVLDGTLQAVPRNVLLLATTNRRTLVPQRFSDRPDPLSDDANAWDTQDEKLALADRFGLIITFPAADQRRYLGIVSALAAERGLDPHGLEADALLFARRHNGFSGRTARQFIDSR